MSICGMSAESAHCIICYAECETHDGTRMDIRSLCQLLQASALELEVGTMESAVDLCSSCQSQIGVLDEILAQVAALMDQMEEIRQALTNQLTVVRNEDHFKNLNALRHLISSQSEAITAENPELEPGRNSIYEDATETECFELKEEPESDVEGMHMEWVLSHSDDEDQDPNDLDERIRPRTTKVKKCSVVIQKLDETGRRRSERGRKENKKFKVEGQSDSEEQKAEGLSSSNSRASRLKKLLKRARVDKNVSTTKWNTKVKIEKETESEPLKKIKREHVHFPCTVESCTKKFQNESALNIHMKKVHEGSKFPYSCQECNKCFKDFQQLVIHRRKSHVPTKGPVECSQCHRILASELGLKTHLRKQGGVCKRNILPCGSRIDNSNKVKKFVCGVCSLHCRSRSMLEYHCLKHTKERPFVCEFCSLSFLRKIYLRHHQLARHPDLLDKPPNDDPLHIHRNPYECDVCSKLFSGPNSLRIHKIQHTKAYKHYCPVCGLGTTNKCKMDLHMVVHSTERSFLCDLCPTTFKRADKLRRHKETVHVKNRPFLCDSCPKAFCDRFGLQRHIRLKHVKDEEKQFGCSLCNQSFALKDYLVVHQKSKKHKDRVFKVENGYQIPDSDQLVEMEVHVIDVILGS